MKFDTEDPAFQRLIKNNGYVFPKRVSGDRIAAISPFIYTTAIVVMTEQGYEFGYEDRWCYHSLPAALVALAEWDGEGEPEGWHRHPDSGRRREDGKEWVAP